MARKECFFYIDPAVADDEQKVETVCVDCYESQQLRSGWYWDKRLGPWLYSCKFCQKVIYDGRPKSKESDEA